MLRDINEATEFVQGQSDNFQPTFGIILGTGLGSLINDVAVAHTIPYEQIPHFPVSTVESHKGNLILGQLEGVNVVVMQGRFHYYEGYDMQQVTFPVRVMKQLGIQRLFVSNAAGGLNPSYQASDLMIIKDHINLLPDNPLRGKNIDALGPRWPDLYDAYDPDMVEQALAIAAEQGVRAHAGVYASVPGPNLETPAEYKFLSVIGADAVGMSTVPEVIVARHMGIPCFAVSAITDLCYPEALQPVAIEHILEAAGKAEPVMTRLIRELIARS